MKNFQIEAASERQEDSIKITVKNLNGTVEVAAILAAVLEPGDMVGFSGELGVGKTEFIRQILRQFGVGDDVVSPSFVLEAVYQAKNSRGIKEISHWDLYRLNGKSAVQELEEYRLSKNYLTFIEWPESGIGVTDLLSLHILLKFSDEKTVNSLENLRKIEFNFKDNLIRRRFLKNLNEYECK